jgi:xanthine dehydrogenase accessory factor
MKVLIIGAGELASGTAHRLFRCGFDVAMTEVAQPLAVRRAVSFCTVVWEGQTTVEGVQGRLRELGESLSAPLDHVAVFVDPELTLLPTWHPDVLVDARLSKRAGATSVAQAPLVVSLGPGAVVGSDAHVVVETQRGHDLGRLIDEGSATPDTGIPGPLGGVTAKRVLRAPAAGPVRAVVQIGDKVEAGDLVAWVGEIPVRATISGVVRGLIRDGVIATPNLKMGDVDPRGDVQSCFTVSDKSSAVGKAVLQAILRCFPPVKT